MLVKYAENCVRPAYEYFKDKFDNDLSNALQLFKLARYFSPAKFSEIRPTSSDLDSLSLFPFLNTEAIEGLKSELPNYQAADRSIGVVEASQR